MYLSGYTIRESVGCEPDTTYNTASMDLHLGDISQCREFLAVGQYDPVDASGDMLSHAMKRTLPARQSLGMGRTPANVVIDPGELLLWMSREYISLPPDVIGFINTKSRFARLGLLSHLTAGVVNPNWEGNIVFEIKNNGPIPLILHPGLAVAEVYFARCETGPLPPTHSDTSGQTKPGRTQA